MIEHYIEAVREALQGVLDLLTKGVFHMSLAVGLLLSVGILILVFGRGSTGLRAVNWRRGSGHAVAWAVIGVFMVAGWAGLRATRPVAQEDMRWRESAEATTNPVPDAAPVSQQGPSVALLTEHTYTRTLVLPPEFLHQIESQGVAALAPYLTDPTGDNVVRLRDRFRHSGNQVVFTRQFTAQEEVPLAFSDSRVNVTFKRLSGRAYDTDFEGHYTFQNSSREAGQVHFLFNLPEAGTIRDVNITVDGDPVVQAVDSDDYEWKHEMAAGEQRQAIVRYHVIGARVWTYNIGSQRRRVEHFQLDAESDGETRFARGSLQALQTGHALHWELGNVVTAQQVALVFPESLSNQLYLHALSVLPASFALFFVGMLMVGAWLGELPNPARLLGGLVLFALGLGASTVLTVYLGPVAGIIIGPLLGAGAATAVLGRHVLLAALPVALLPAAFLSAQNSGLLVLLLSALTMAIIWWAVRVGRNAEPQVAFGFWGRYNSGTTVDAQERQ